MKEWEANQIKRKLIQTEQELDEAIEAFMSSYISTWDEKEDLREKLKIAVKALEIIKDNNYFGINNHAQGTALVALDKIRTL
jgi:hypothetical protein